MSKAIANRAGMEFKYPKEQRKARAGIAIALARRESKETNRPGAKRGGYGFHPRPGGRHGRYVAPWNA